MVKKGSVKKMCAAGTLLALSVLLPQLFHLIGGQAAGGMFLPMHIPVLISGLLLGPAYGAFVGAVSPAVSFMLTGMPAAVKLPFMVIELTVYGLTAGLCAKRRGLYFSLILAQLCGRLANAVALLAALYVFQLHVPPIATVWTAIVTGLPGIAIQLAFIPGLVIILKKVISFDTANRAC